MSGNISFVLSSPERFILDPSNLPRNPVSVVIMWCFVVLVLIAVLLNMTVITACALRRFDKPMVRYIAVTSMVDTYWGVYGIGSYTYNITVGPRFMFFADCISQMFFRHVFLLGQFLMITVMYVDRHCAIFWPYTYASWTTRRSGTLETLTLVWSLAVLFALVFPVAATQLSFCTDPVVVKGASCIFGIFSKAACNDRFLPNIVTACVLYFFMGQSALIAVYSTWCILRMCHKSNMSETSTKALQTCLTQLIFFSTHFLSVITTSLLNRGFIHDKNAHFFFVLLVNSVPTTVNPLIFGLRTKEIRTPIVNAFQRWRRVRCVMLATLLPQDGNFTIQR